MKAKVKPTEDIEQLKANLEPRVESIEVVSDYLEVELVDTAVLERTPGIESFEIDGSEESGIGGTPIDEQAYIKIESREDAVKAFLATMKGYDLRVLNTGRDWDLRKLKQYNPDIKHLKIDEPADFLNIDKSVSDIEGTETIEVETPGEASTVDIYRRFLT